MEKKIEVEIDGKRVRIMPHLLEDASMFGASTVKRVTKEPPKELSQMPVKKVLPPTNLEVAIEKEPEKEPEKLPVKKVLKAKKPKA